MSVTAWTQSRLWDPLGMEFDGAWTLDSEAAGFEKMEAGLNARAIDFAKLGRLFLHEGEWDGRGSSRRSGWPRRPASIRRIAPRARTRSVLRTDVVGRRAATGPARLLRRRRSRPIRLRVAVGTGWSSSGTGSSTACLRLAGSTRSCAQPINCDGHRVDHESGPLTDGPTGTTPTNTTIPPDVAAESEAILGERPISVEALGLRRARGDPRVPRRLGGRGSELAATLSGASRDSPTVSSNVVTDPLAGARTDCPRCPRTSTTSRSSARSAAGGNRRPGRESSR